MKHFTRSDGINHLRSSKHYIVWVCVCKLAVFIEYANRVFVSRIILSSVACLPLSCFSTQSHKRQHFLIYIQGGAKRTHVFLICLRFLSLGLPQIKSLRSNTSYSRRSGSFHSRRNCNCATRNVSKCDAELWGEAPDVCMARRTPSFRYNFP